MKKLILFASILTTLLITSCTKDANLGTGIVVTEERNSKNFDGVEVTGSLEVHLIQSKQFRVKIESYENLIPYVETFVSNGVLQVRMANGFQNGGNETVVWVYAPAVYEINLNGSGFVVTDNYHNFKDYLEVNLQGSGDITVRGTARTADVTLYGSGIVRLDGSASNLTIENSGSGDVRAYDFSADQANVKIFGSGNALIDVWRYLDAEIVGSGDIIYEGNPRVLSFKSGSGLIRRR
jgi:hypothetical protein